MVEVQLLGHQLSSYRVAGWKQNFSLWYKLRNYVMWDS